VNLQTTIITYLINSIMMKYKYNIVSFRWCMAACMLFLMSFLVPGPSIGKGLAAAQEFEVPIASNDFTNRAKMISLSIKDVPLAEALSELAQKADVGLSFNPAIMPDTRATLNVAHVSVRQAVDSLLGGTNLQAILPTTRDVIIIKEKPTQEQRKAATIQGTVTDSQSGETLPGVNIIVKGTTTGTATGTSGEYSLEVASLQDTLVFSFIGYEKQVVPINGRTEINVQMVSETLTGEELVVVGYGTQEKSDLTGSVGSVDS